MFALPRSAFSLMVLVCAVFPTGANRLPADEFPDAPPVTMHETEAGVPFAVLGEKPAAPAPTLFVFGGDMRSSLISEDVNRLGRLLMRRGWLCVSLDVPCHGADAREGETSGDLGAWKNRIVNGENIVERFNASASSVLDDLIANGYTDAEHIAVSGTSRGGFCAIHFGASDERVKQVIAFAPVTHLPALREFEGAEMHADVLALSCIHVADRLVGKPMWMIIGNHDTRVGTNYCLDFAQKVILLSDGKHTPIPVEFRLAGTIDHRLHASPAKQYKQFCAPHDEAASWLLEQMSVP